MVKVSGELDLYSNEEFRSVLGQAEDSENALIVLDLLELGFIDSSGLGAVIGLQGRCQKSERRLVIVVEPEGVIAKTFEVTGLHQALTLAESLDEALLPVEGDGEATRLLGES